MKHGYRMKTSGFGAEFFKYLVNYDDRFAIAFAIYGPESSRFIIHYALLTMHGDGLGAVGLAFTRMEFDDLVCKRFPPSQYYFHPSFFDEVFGLTGVMWEQSLTL
jgi:hypothetical protein